MPPESPVAPDHDAFTRLLHRLEPDPEALWEEAEPLVVKHQGVLVLDDATLDHLSARHTPLVTHHWSGTHRETVRGINLISLGGWHALAQRKHGFDRLREHAHAVREHATRPTGPY
ncbi:MAG: hypothetical protein JO034_11015 [Singulisphaera sp.]|nr:hypothetical protein [Singulisphaera sp.]